MGQILWKGFDLKEMTFFGKTSETEQILAPKIILLNKMSHIQ